MKTRPLAVARSTPLRVDVDKMASRVFIVDAQGNRCAESLRLGFADNAVPKLNAFDEVVAALRAMVKAGEYHFASTGWPSSFHAGALTKARAALDKAGP